MGEQHKLIIPSAGRVGLDTYAGKTLILKVARVTGRQAPPTFTSGGVQVLGLNIKILPTDSADET